MVCDPENQRLIFKNEFANVSWSIQKKIRGAPDMTLLAVDNRDFALAREVQGCLDELGEGGAAIAVRAHFQAIAARVSSALSFCSGLTSRLGGRNNVVEFSGGDSILASERALQAGEQHNQRRRFQVVVGGRA
jgi:hypothetical protein